MQRNNDRIMSSQLSAILSVTIIGVGILSLPRVVVEGAGPDHLIVIALAAVLALVMGLIMVVLVKKFPGQTLAEFSEQLVGKVAGKILTAGFGLYFLIFAAIEVRVFGEVTKQYLLFQTPIEVLSITILVLAVYLARSGIEPIARMAEIIFPIATVIAIVTVLPIIGELDLSYIKPILRTPPWTIIKTVPTVFFSYIGIETMLLFSGFVKDTKKITRSVFLTIGLVTWFYLSVTWITVGRFGLVETTHIVWPVLELFKTVDIPGAFIENIEAFIMSIWILSVFMTLAVVYYASALCFSKVIEAKEHNYLVLPLLPVIYFIALLPNNIAQISDFMDIYSNYMGTFYVAVVPIVLLGISMFKKQKGGKKSA